MPGFAELDTTVGSPGRYDRSPLGPGQRLANPLRVVGKIPLDHRELEPRENRLFRLTLEQECE